MPPLQLVAAYPDTGHHDDDTPRATDAQRVGEQLTAARLGQDRRAARIPSPGSPMPYAHRTGTADAESVNLSGAPLGGFY